MFALIEALIFFGESYGQKSPFTHQIVDLAGTGMIDGRHRRMGVYTSSPADDGSAAQVAELVDAPP